MSNPSSSQPCSIASVLIVDDSIVQREHVTKICHEIGIRQVHEAGNGREALALLSTLSPLPELLIVDLEMPTMDGPELLERLQQRGIDIPIIVGSSHERVLIHAVQDMGQVLGLRILSAFQKPLRAEGVLAALKKLSLEPKRGEPRAAVAISVTELRDAIENREISVHYQPKADIRTGVVRGVEALARWRHPSLGFVPADQFIRLAEQNELIHPLTLHVMNEAMLQVAAWRARGIHLSVALNLSAQLLDRFDIAKEIASLQQSHQLSADQVVIEVTESSLVRHLGTALGVLARLRLRGFGLSIDDYGTGFASMQQLARIPFTEIKIDRSFVHGAHERENLQVILRSALDMAHQLGLTSVAEGVETMQDWRMLQRFGCTLGQGWLIARAMPGDEIGTWLKQHRVTRRDLAQPGEPSIDDDRAATCD